MTFRRAHRATAVAAALILATTLSGCSLATSMLLGGGGDAQRDQSGNVTEKDNIDIFSLKVGDCKMTDADGEVQATDVVPCEEPHDEEVYFEFDLEGDELPSSEQIEAAVGEKCIPAFDEYVGTMFEESTLDIRWLEPTQLTWTELDDRLVQCIIVDAAGDQLEGSMKGAKR
ncbi:septum formation family protein [Microbacterium sp. H1-D42]|uniref:septum formation family protein n=1 Tax=Microbacterium sp. H1-D42 TaxID=2925844 RepID=UPI001F5300F7|nr:septum formation family protein [Microbacterium sp. H1-D42]UNK72285.1 septum formation family protein [Microbacterium sp. H1-D42]